MTDEEKCESENYSLHKPTALHRTFLQVCGAACSPTMCRAGPPWHRKVATAMKSLLETSGPTGGQAFLSMAPRSSLRTPSATSSQLPSLSSSEIPDSHSAGCGNHVPAGAGWCSWSSSGSPVPRWIVAGEAGGQSPSSAAAWRGGVNGGGKRSWKAAILGFGGCCMRARLLAHRDTSGQEPDERIERICTGTVFQKLMRLGVLLNLVARSEKLGVISRSALNSK